MAMSPRWGTLPGAQVHPTALIISKATSHTAYFKAAFLNVVLFKYPSVRAKRHVPLGLGAKLHVPLGLGAKLHVPLGLGVKLHVPLGLGVKLHVPFGLGVKLCLRGRNGTDVRPVQLRNNFKGNLHNFVLDKTGA
jgi:hypothetical protein